MHTAQDGDKKLAELWDKNMSHAGFATFHSEYRSDVGRGAIRKFASDLVDDKFQDLRAVCDSALKELAALKAANTQDTQPEPAETEDERNGREMCAEWLEVCGNTYEWAEVDQWYRDAWIAFAKRRPKVEKPAPKLREPGQVLCDAMCSELTTLIAWVDCSDDRKCTFNRVARKLGIEAQP